MSILEASPPARGLVREVGLSEANSRVTGKQEATPKCPQSIECCIDRDGLLIGNFTVASRSFRNPVFEESGDSRFVIR